MPLADPKVYYRTVRDAILTVLRDNVATLNTGLTRGKITNTGRQIRAGHPGVIPVNTEQYPTIMVKLTKKIEEFEQLGHAGRKRPFLLFTIYGLVINPVLDMGAENDIMQLCSNAEGLFRNNITVDATTVYTDVRDADFNVSERFENNNYLDVFSFELYARVEVK